MLLTYVILPTRKNYDELLKEDVVPIWLLTQNFQVNWTYGMVSYMFKCQKTNLVWLPYEGLITKFLVKVEINLDNETLSSSSRQNDAKSLSLIKV